MANNQQLAFDNFASGSLAAGWSVWPNASGQKPQIVSGSPNVAEPPSLVAPGGVIWTEITWPDNQISEVTFHQNLNGANDFAHIFVRVNAAGTTGYEAFFNSGRVFINDYASGTSFVGPISVTTAADDVWALQAAGCDITLYQNGKPVAFVADATYPTGGSPGFGLKSSSALTDLQVSSWRGYSCVQQDGIWQKQGPVLVPLAGDLASNSQGFFGGTFIQDTNPQILAGPTVYKTWFSGGTVGSQSTYYAESPDLKTWTRYASAVIANYVGAMMIKVGSTYHSYSQVQNAQGTGNIAHHTSTDGITWTLQSANVLSPGAVGTWDATGFYPLRPITVINGTWYALTTGSQSGVFKIGLATSPDGSTWTKYAGNPTLVLSYSVFPMQAFVLINGTYYFWHDVGPDAPQLSDGNTFLPGETARFSTTDFIHWSAPVRSLHHSDMYEGLNEPISTTPAMPGAALNPSAIFQVGNKTYAIGQTEVLDGAGGGTQFSLAIAPAPPSSIVLFNEDAVVQTQTDGFTSGAGDLDANWTTLSGFTKLKIVAGNLCEPSVATSVKCAMAFTGASFSSSHYAEITLATLSAIGALASPLVCADAVTGNHYRVILAGATGTQSYQAQLAINVAGTSNGLGPVVGITPNVGDVLRLQVIQSPVGNGGANVPVLSFFQNGSMILQYVDQGTTALSGGGPGVIQAEAASGTSQVSSWAGGNANVVPNYFSSIADDRFIQQLTTQMNHLDQI